MSDNGPPYSSEEFSSYAKKLGFKHRKIVPLAPWANGTAEKFMRSLGKVVRISHADRKNWKHELTKFLRAYRATPHCTTGETPAALMFPNRHFKTTLPSVQESEDSPAQKRAQETDSRRKAIMKQNADAKAYVRPTNIQPGDRLLLAQKKINKLTTPYELKPYTAITVNGSMVTANNGLHTVTRHVNLFKKVPKPKVTVDQPQIEPLATEDTDMPAESQQMEEPESTQDDAHSQVAEEVTQAPNELSSSQEQEGVAAETTVRRSTRNATAPVRYRDPGWETHLR